MESESPMKRLVLTGEHGVTFMRSELSDLVIPFSFRFAWGPLPSPDAQVLPQPKLPKATPSKTCKLHSAACA